MRVRFVAITMALIMIATMSTGCMGRSALGKKLFTWNYEFHEGRWERAGTFFGLYAVGVYPIVGFIDLFIINSMEFWTGENPYSKEKSLLPLAVREFTTEDGTQVTMRHESDDTVSIALVSPGGFVEHYTMERTAEGVLITDGNGLIMMDPTLASLAEAS